MRRPASPPPYSWSRLFRSAGASPAASARAAAPIADASAPTRRFHPAVTVSTHSVSSRIVTHGTPRSVASFWRPPESVSTPAELFMSVSIST